MAAYTWKAHGKIPYSVLDKEYRVGSVVLRPPLQKSGDEVDFIEIVTPEYITQDKSRHAALELGLGKLSRAVPLWRILTGKQFEISDKGVELMNEEALRDASCTIEAVASLTADAILVHHVNDEAIKKLGIALEVAEAVKDEASNEERLVLEWLHRGIFETEPVNRFLCVWIAFNILYASCASSGKTDRARIDSYGRQMAACLDEGIIARLKNSASSISEGQFVSRNKHDDGAEFLNAIRQCDMQRATVAFLHCAYDVRCKLFHEGHTITKLGLFSDVLRRLMSRWIEVRFHASPPSVV